MILLMLPLVAVLIVGAVPVPQATDRTIAAVPIESRIGARAPDACRALRSAIPPLASPQ